MIGNRMFAVAVLDTTSVMVAVIALITKLTTQDGRNPRDVRFFTNHWEKPLKNHVDGLLNVTDEAHWGDPRLPQKYRKIIRIPSMAKASSWLFNK